MKSWAFQRWCSPKTILVAADSSTHPGRIQEVIGQVRGPGVELMLVTVLRQDSMDQSSRRALPFIVPNAQFRFAESTAEGMQRALRWGEVMSEVDVLKSTTVDRLPALAHSLNVDRVVSVSSGNGPMPMRLKGSIEEGLIDSLRVPLCIMGSRSEARPWGNDEIRRVLLPISFDSDVKLHLSFASQLARSHRARLTVLHVFRSQETSARPWERTPVAVQSQLPILELMREGMLCPLEITVAEGDPAAAILKFDAMRQHDLIVMGSPARSDHNNGIVQAVIFGARCPLIVLGRSLALAPGADELVPKAGRTGCEPPVDGLAEEEKSNAVR